MDNLLGSLFGLLPSTGKNATDGSTKDDGNESHLYQGGLCV